MPSARARPTSVELPLSALLTSWPGLPSSRDAVSTVSADPEISTRPICVAPLTKPGVTGLPRASMVLTPAGTSPPGVTETIRRPSTRIVASGTVVSLSIVHASAWTIASDWPMPARRWPARSRSQASSWPCSPASQLVVGDRTAAESGALPRHRPVDQHQVGAAVDAEGVAGPQHHVGLKARRDRADALVQPQHARKSVV